MPRNCKGRIVQRRTFVTTASATIATASIAGCSGILGGGGGGGSSGPEAAVEGWIQAGQDGDTEAMQEYAHPEGDLTRSEASETSGDISIESIETTEDGDDRATVTAEVEISGEVNGEDVSQAFTYQFDVRKHEGEWKIYTFVVG